MGKYDKYSPSSFAPGRPWDIHPVWRGIGCLFMLLIPVLSYAGAIVLVEANLRDGWVPLSRELAAEVLVPAIGPVPHLYANLIAAALLMLLGFGLLVVFYSLLFRLVGYGPPKPGLKDAPPVRRTRR